MGRGVAILKDLYIKAFTIFFILYFNLSRKFHLPSLSIVKKFEEAVGGGLWLEKLVGEISHILSFLYVYLF